jgi:hypothetical protein
MPRRYSVCTLPLLLGLSQGANFHCCVAFSHRRAKKPHSNRTYAVSVFSLRQSGTFLFSSFPIFALGSAKMGNIHDKVPCCRRRNLAQSRPLRNSDSKKRKYLAATGKKVLMERIPAPAPYSVRPYDAAPSSAVLGLRMTCTGICVSSSRKRPLWRNASRNAGSSSGARMRGGMPPPR